LPEKWDVVLVGRRTSGRALLVERLRDAGLRVATGGLGWPEGLLSRPEMLARYAQAAVVLTTADWEGHPVPMVKHRLLDTAMLGCFQVAQEAPDLRRYFPATEVPAYDSPEELLAQVRRALADPAARLAAADAARRRALAEHTWQVRWPSLFAGLGVAAPPPPGAAPEATREASPGGRSRLFDQALLALASRAEADGRPGAAAALAGELLLRDPGQPTAAAIRGRCLRDLGDPAGALPLLEQAAAAAAAPGAAALFVQLSPQGVGCGLGRFGLWPPAAEPTVFLLAALLQLGRHDEALARIAGLSPGPLAEAVATVLDPGDAPELAPVREALARWRPVGR
ncbi:MAG: glycosyltransferase, partial [Myxococcota bacterium]|nr:glycosyltransferase [Myxococcota bacterium]